MASDTQTAISPPINETILYARREFLVDGVHDVALYENADAISAIVVFTHSGRMRPKRGHSVVKIAGVRHQLRWLPDARRGLSAPSPFTVRDPSGQSQDTGAHQSSENSTPFSPTRDEPHVDCRSASPLR